VTPSPLVGGTTAAPESNHLAKRCQASRGFTADDCAAGIALDGHGRRDGQELASPVKTCRLSRCPGWLRVSPQTTAISSRLVLQPVERAVRYVAVEHPGIPARTCAVFASMPLQVTCATVRPYLSSPPPAAMGRTSACCLKHSAARWSRERAPNGWRCSGASSSARRTLIVCADASSAESQRAVSVSPSVIATTRHRRTEAAAGTPVPYSYVGNFQSRPPLPAVNMVASSPNRSRIHRAA
jgi:hypothetical protein